MDLTFVSTNAGKFREVREILAGYGVHIRWKRRALPEIQAATLEHVVEAKLDAAARLGGRILVEDSGLFIPALRGFPGVYSASALDTIGLGGVLRLLEGKPRPAVFRTVAGVSIGRRKWVRRGECRGRIAERARGANGFGYDPIFIPDGESRTFGQMTTAEKNEWSHRARAIRRVGRLLEHLD